MTQAGSVRACNRLEDMVTRDNLAKLSDAYFKQNICTQMFQILFWIYILCGLPDKDMVMTMLIISNGK